MTAAATLTQDWLVTLYRRPPVTDLTQHPNAEVREVYALWQDKLGGMDPARMAPEDPEEHEWGVTYGDDEDALEQLYRLWAVRAHTPDGRIWVRFEGETRNLATGEVHTGDTAALRRFGPLHRGERDAVDHAADRYADLSAFTSRAGRDLAICGFYPDTGRELRDELISHAGCRVVVKVNRRKYAIVALDVPAGADESCVMDLLYDDERLGGALMHFEGAPDAFLVQEWVPMRFEYRVFIVDGRPVTGAGCVEEFTPADRVPGRAFDTRVREGRGIAGGTHTDDVHDDPEVVAHLIDFATEAAAAIAAEAPHLTEYAMDVALGPDDRPLIIELNGLPNSGLYATDPSLVFAALAARS